MIKNFRVSVIVEYAPVKPTAGELVIYKKFTNSYRSK